MKGKLLIIGFGPGSFDHITKRAREAIQESEVIIGYNTYVDLISGLLTDQEIVRTGMTEEVSRAQEAVRQAEMGKIVAVISSGDAGVYGMAGLVYEVLIEKSWNPATGVAVEVIPGISAINSSASLLGAPVMHDACTISLSDHLTPWELIAKRLEAAGQADFVVALYNPRSGRRTRQIVEAQRILLQYRSPDTPVGIVKSAYRDREDIVVTTLANMLDHDIGMLTTVIIGNTSTFNYEGLMITPRGYQRKYTLDSDTQQLKPHQRLQREAEPWALEQSNESIDYDDFDEDEADRSDSGTAASHPSQSSLELAMEALLAVKQSRGESIADLVSKEVNVPAPRSGFKQEMIFEFAVSPGVANKKFSAAQMLALAEVTGDKGSIEYTTNHQMIVRIPTADPDQVTAKLKAEGLLLSAIGDVVQVKACDFCNGEKEEAIPYAEQLTALLGGKQVPKELKIGINGCGMACYGAVNDDIGIVYRRGKFDLFLGGKSIGRNAHPGLPVAEGIEPNQLVAVIERIVARFQEKGHPNERFHKFFSRVKNIEGFEHRQVPVLVIENAVCGD